MPAFSDAPPPAKTPERWAQKAALVRAQLEASRQFRIDNPDLADTDGWADATSDTFDGSD